MMPTIRFEGSSLVVVSAIVSRSLFLLDIRRRLLVTFVSVRDLLVIIMEWHVRIEVIRHVVWRIWFPEDMTVSLWR